MKKHNFINRQLVTLYYVSKNMCRKNDLTKFNYIPTINRPIYGIYHIYCYGNWKSLFEEQIIHLINSGLYNVTTKLYISVISKSDNDIQWIEKHPLLNNNNFGGIIARHHEGSSYEYPALDFIMSFSKNKDACIYYFHSKGVTYHGRNDLQKDLAKRIKLGEEWRYMMEYFNFDNWKVAYNVLKTYDTYGCRLNDEYFPLWNREKYYAGNFWWANTQWINRLSPIEKEKKDNRWYAELWLLSKPGRFFCAFWGYYGEYNIAPHKCLYNKNLRVNIFYKQYYFVKFFFQYYMFYISYYKKKTINKIKTYINYKSI